MSRKRAAQLDREISEALRGKRRTRSAHSSKRLSDPKEQLVELLTQDSDEARQIARDLLLEHGIIQTGTVHAVRTIGDSFSGPITQIDIGSYRGALDPKRYWMVGPTSEVPAVGSSIDFTSVNAYPPTGKSAYAPRRQLTPVKILSLKLPASVIQKWIDYWWIE